MATEKPLSQVYLATKTPRRAIALGAYHHYVRPALGGISRWRVLEQCGTEQGAATRSFFGAPSRTWHPGESRQRYAHNHAASYRTPDREGIKQALAETGVDLDAKLSGDFFDLHIKKKAS
jgi:hypothetical protein